jgi:hypothetical protein
MCTTEYSKVVIGGNSNRASMSVVCLAHNITATLTGTGCGLHRRGGSGKFGRSAAASNSEEKSRISVHTHFVC